MPPSFSSCARTAAGVRPVPLAEPRQLGLDLRLESRQCPRAAQPRRARARWPPLRAPRPAGLSGSAAQSMSAFRGSTPCSISRRGEVLDPAVELPLDERLGHVEGHPRGQLLQQVAARRRARPSARLRAADPARTRGRSASSVSNSPRSLANSSSSSGTTRRLSPLIVTCSRRRCRPAPSSRSRRDSDREALRLADRQCRSPRRRTPADWPRRRSRS